MNSLLLVKEENLSERKGVLLSVELCLASSAQKREGGIRFADWAGSLRPE